jgi:glutamate racemase
MYAPNPRPVALLDSGVGGLSILREVRRQLPNEDVLYFADQAHVPYGPREADEIRCFARGITRFFLARGAKVVVVSCNAASAASLYHLRETFVDVPFVGMEPAVKPAAARTHSGVIGVITTKATFQGALFASVVERFTEGVTVVTQVCPDFVTLVEDGQLDTPAVRQAGQAYLGPLSEANIDQLVLGCTHFPFLIPVLADLIGPSVEIIDPGPAVARQVGRVIAESRHAPDRQGKVSYFTSGDPDRFHQLAARLVGEPLSRDQVQGVSWQGEEIVLRG